MKNKTGYMAGQSRTIGQGQQCKNRPQFKNVTDGPTNRYGKVYSLESRIRQRFFFEKKNQIKKNRKIVLLSSEPATVWSRRPGDLAQMPPIFRDQKEKNNGREDAVEDSRVRVRVLASIIANSSGSASFFS